MKIYIWEKILGQPLTLPTKFVAVVASCYLEKSTKIQPLKPFSQSNMKCGKHLYQGKTQNTQNTSTTEAKFPEIW